MIRSFFLLYILLFSQSVFAQIKFPEVFPKEFINKEICGHVEVYAKDYWTGKTNFSQSADFDYKITISETEGIFVEYNPGERWNDKARNGTSQKITNFELWKKEDKYSTDKYGDIIDEYTIYEYKVYYNPLENDGHYIKGFHIKKRKNSTSIVLQLNVNSHQDANIYFSLQGKEINPNVCGVIKSLRDIEIEKQAIEQIKLNKLKDDTKRVALINKYINEQKMDLAKIEFDKLNFPENYSNRAKFDAEYEKYLISVKNVEDVITEKTIQELLTSASLNEALIKFQDFNFSENNVKSKQRIQHYLDSAYSNYVENFDLTISNQLFNIFAMKVDNSVSSRDYDVLKFSSNQITLKALIKSLFEKGVLMDLSIGAHILTIGNKGEVSLDNKTLSLTTTPIKKYDGKSDVFYTNIAVTIPFEVKEQKIKSERALSSTKMSIYIYQSNNGGNLLSMDGMVPSTLYVNYGGNAQNYKVVPSSYDESIPKNKYYLVQDILIQNKIGDLIIFSKTETVIFYEKGKLKKLK